jgi:hypothetical protein
MSGFCNKPVTSFYTSLEITIIFIGVPNIFAGVTAEGPLASQ